MVLGQSSARPMARRMREASGLAGCASGGIRMSWLSRWPTRMRGLSGLCLRGTNNTIRRAARQSAEAIKETEHKSRRAQVIAATWLGMVKGALPSLSEPDVWTGTAPADASGALRRKHAEIHRGSRRRRIGPLEEAGYTSAIANSKPDQIRALQSGGAHIHPHTLHSQKCVRRRRDDVSWDMFQDHEPARCAPARRSVHGVTEPPPRCRTPRRQEAQRLTSTAIFRELSRVLRSPAGCPSGLHRRRNTALHQTRKRRPTGEKT